MARTSPGNHLSPAAATAAAAAAATATAAAVAVVTANQFLEVNRKLDALALDVRSLLDTRTYSRGVLKAALVVGPVLAVISTLMVEYFRH